MNPITREESLLDGQDLTPITRKEQFIKRIYDKTQEIPEPITREEWFLKKAGEGTSPVAIEQLNVTENGTYSETGKAYSPVIVEVPAPTLITKTITENGTYTASEDNADGYSQVTVNVPYMEKKSASGDIASFSDGAGYPFLKVKANINPVQDLHGYDYPWVGGAGKNKCSPNFSDWTIGSAYTYMKIPSFTGETYVMSFVDKDTSVDLTGINLGFMNNYPTETSEYRWVINNGVVQSNKTNIAEHQVKCDTLIIYPRTESAFNLLFQRYDIQVELGSSVTAFAPYSNICPISGFTGVNVAVTGVNIWDEEWELGAYDTTTGVKTVNANVIRSANKIPILPNTTYRFLRPAGQGAIYILYYDMNGNYIRNDYAEESVDYKVFTSASNVYYITFYLGRNYGTTYNNDISINYPSTDTSYHAYNGHVYPISWQDEAGIVYGGYIDLVSGVLTATKRHIIFDGSNDENWQLFINAGSGINQLYISISNVATSAGIGGGNTLCDKFKSISIDNRGGNYNTCYAGVDGLCFNMKDFTVEMWRNWLANNNVDTVYTLATPQTYQLTPQQINTLIGQNNAWNNTNGQTEVEYFIPIE